MIDIVKEIHREHRKFLMDTHRTPSRLYLGHHEFSAMQEELYKMSRFYVYNEPGRMTYMGMTIHRVAEENHVGLA